MLVVTAWFVHCCSAGWWFRRWVVSPSGATVDFSRGKFLRLVERRLCVVLAGNGLELGEAVVRGAWPSRRTSTTVSTWRLSRSRMS